MSPAAPVATKAAVATACRVVRDLTYCSNNITLLYYDGKVRNGTDCTLDTCSLLVSHWGYLPNIPANAFFLALFGVLACLALPLGIWKKTWGCLFGLFLGCTLEAVGTAGRIMAAKNPFAFNPFVIYLLFLTVAPAFLSAAIYLCLARIMVVYGESNARWKPRTYGLVFMFSDLVALVLQGAGGGIAAQAKDDQDKANRGINIMIAGLVWQVVSLTLFAAAAGDFWWCVKQGRGESDSRFLHLRSRKRWTGFLYALSVATVLIYIRSCYRVAELVQGFTGKIADNEPAYMIFEPTLIVLSCFLLVGFHPSYVFGNMWHQADYRQSGEKDTTLEKGAYDDDASEITGEAEKKGLKIKIFGKKKGKDRPVSMDEESIIAPRNRWSGPVMHAAGCPNRQRHHHNHSQTAYYSPPASHHEPHRGPNQAFDTNARTPLLSAQYSPRRPSDTSTYSSHSQHDGYQYPRSASASGPRRPSTAYGRAPQTAVYPPPRPARDSYAEVQVKQQPPRRTSQQWQAQNWSSGSSMPQSARPPVNESAADRWVAAHRSGVPQSASLAPRTPFVKETRHEW